MCKETLNCSFSAPLINTQRRVFFQWGLIRICSLLKGPITLLIRTFSDLSNNGGAAPQPDLSSGLRRLEK